MTNFSELRFIQWTCLEAVFLLSVPRAKLLVPCPTCVYRYTVISFEHRWAEALSIRHQINSLMGTLKLQSNGPLYRITAFLPGWLLIS